jgi:glucose-6-phosphate 1-dehydrogenase
LEIQPNENINISFNVKEHGNKKEMQKIKSSFIKEAVGQESYERLIEDVIL